MLANTPDVNRFTFGVDRDALLSSLLVERISKSDISSRSVGETMKTFVFLAVVLLLGLTDLSAAKNSSPKVQVYTRSPGQYGTANTLICHVSGFHPPEITIELLKNDKVIPGSQQTDLAFEENWHYHMTKHVPFTPTKEDVFSCRVTHTGKKRTYIWEADM
ncbi:unnamed protein product [Oreochromis niloticus]|nr:unnamed protein product [Mustela putorius furo]